MKANKQLQIFSKNLNYYLKEKNYTQSDLVSLINVSKSTVSTWCRGTRFPRLNHLNELTATLGIEKSMLLEDKNKQEYKEICNILDNIKSILQDNKNLLLDGKPLNQECANLLISAIQEGVELIKEKN